MADPTDVDYGPLATLIGTWRGDRGMDIAPDPAGLAENPYFETLVFAPIGRVTNANDQVLVGLRYHQCVSLKSSRQPFHDQVGYWLWDASTATIVQSLLIPRAVGLLAAGSWSAGPGPVVLDVASDADDAAWGIVQSPFMRNNARTVGFRHRIVIDGDSLTYDQTTIVDIYGKRFEHTDANTLVRA
jgi:methylamine---glutamate N-methyltransferase subunit C